MKQNLITDVIQGMLPYLNNAQTERLQEVLQYTLFDYEVTKIKKDEELSEQNLVESFLSAKRIEGCSEKTLKYYNATIQSMLDGIGKSIKYIVTDDIRCYLTEYQAKKKRFCSLSKKQENIRVQRNKIYAHNDEKHILAEEKVWDKNPVTYPDIQELIDFALDCTRLILGALTGVSRAVSYGNIDDMEGTLMLAKLGLKYQDYEMEQRHKQILKEIYADKKE